MNYALNKANQSTHECCLVTPHNDCVKIDWLDDYFGPPSPRPPPTTATPNLIHQCHRADHFPKHWPKTFQYFVYVCVLCLRIFSCCSIADGFALVDALSKANLNIDFISSYTQFYSWAVVVVAAAAAVLFSLFVVDSLIDNFAMRKAPRKWVLCLHTHTTERYSSAQVLYSFNVKIGKVLGRNNCRKYCWPNNTPNVWYCERMRERYQLFLRTCQIFRKLTIWFRNSPAFWHIQPSMCVCVL